MGSAPAMFYILLVIIIIIIVIIIAYRYNCNRFNESDAKVARDTQQVCNNTCYFINNYYYYY